MPELRGIQGHARDQSGVGARYKLYVQAPGVPHDKKMDRTERINYVAEK